MNTSQWCSAVWSVFCSMPLRLQVTVVLALVLLGAGLVAAWLWCSQLLRRRGGESR